MTQSGARAARWFKASFFATMVVAFPVESIHRFGSSFLVSNAAEADDGDWTYADHDISGTRYSPLNQITSQNVNQLAKVCSYTFPEAVPSPPRRSTR
jgi:glucose dehydrogenase